MKLICLYIENFGGLHQYKLDFEAGLTTLTEPNGFGKTTLAEFIRAMFYGFPRKSKTLEKSRRQKYTPWNGGAFGGNLTFAHEGRCYRIERSFGANPKGDSFSVVDPETGRKISRFTEDIGQELFGLDADSFERSTYLPQLRDSGSMLTASIQAKLSNLVEDSSDVANFDKAMAVLKAARSALIPYRGSGGKAAEAAAQITRLQLRLDTLQAMEVQLKTAQEEAAQARHHMEETKALLSQTVQRLQIAAGQEADRLRRQQYTQLCERYRAAEAVLQGCRRKYAGGLPQEDSLYRAEILAERMEEYEDSSNGKEHGLTVQQLDNCSLWCEQYSALQLSVHEMERWAAELEQTQLPEAHPVGSFKIPAVLTACGAAAVVTGSLWAFFAERSYGMILLVGGGLLTALGIGLLFTQNRKKREHQREVFLQKQDIRERLADMRQKTDLLKKKTEEKSRELAAFFAQRGVSVQNRQYTAALAELKSRTAAMEQRKAQIAAAHEQLQTFFLGLGISDAADYRGTLRQLREDMGRIQSARILQQELKEQLAQMENSCGDILFVEESDMEDPVRLREEEQRLRRGLTEQTTRMLQAEQSVLRLRENLSELPAVREALEQARQDLAAYREKAKLLDAAMEFLQQARENLSTAYMGTIRSRFGYYLNILSSAQARYFVDSDLQIYLERGGQVREIAYFSAGQGDMLMLCMRLSLVDALFRGQKTFLILDDPFVNLDDAHLKKAEVLLRKLAEEHQILYLTCHSGRNISS